jgi:hypothetical protein
VFNGIIGAILASVLSREVEAIGRSMDDGNRVVDKIDVLGGPLLIILDEAVVEVTGWQSVCTMLIVT